MKIKILLVDDEYEKVQNIASAIKEAGIQEVDIRHESTGNAARLALHHSAFDFLLIDLNLPSTIGSAPTKDGGIQFLDMLMLDVDVTLPTDVLFLTAREELIQDAHVEAIKRGVGLCKYSIQDQCWKAILIGRLRYLAKRLEQRKHMYPSVDIVVVTALRRPELDAVLGLKYSWKSLKIGNDPLTYQIGSIPRTESPLSVVAVSAFRKGMPSSAALVSKMCSFFRPKFLVMLGICAGVRGKTNLGDIVVADPSWDWGSGKQTEDQEGSPVFLASPYQRPLHTHMSQLALEFSERSDVISAIRGGWEGSAPQGKLQVHVGPMASGASVLADSGTLKGISAQQREVLAVEMEAYAVMAATEYANSPTPIAMAIKSVCDFADPEKNDTWQEYASYTSAAFFDQIFRTGMLPK